MIAARKGWRQGRDGRKTLRDAGVWTRRRPEVSPYTFAQPAASDIVMAGGLEESTGHVAARGLFRELDVSR